MTVRRILLSNSLRLKIMRARNIKKGEIYSRKPAINYPLVLLRIPNKHTNLRETPVRRSLISSNILTR